MEFKISFRAWHKFKKEMIKNPCDEQGGISITNINQFFEDKDYVFLQYTWLKDANNKEIYVGDILSEKWKVEVVQNYYGTFIVKFHENPNENRPQTLREYLFKRERAGTKERDCVVIGNIYENDQLLNK